MKKVTQLNHYEILNVKPTATKAEIQHAYSKICKTYQVDSLAVYSIISDDEREDMQRRIEDAYSTLIDDNKRREYNQAIGLSPFEVKDEPSEGENGSVSVASKEGQEMVGEFSEIDPLSKGFLREYREMKGISLKEISESTNISLVMLSALENGEYKKLPGRAYAIGFLREYAKYLDIDYQKAKQNFDTWAKW